MDIVQQIKLLEGLIQHIQLGDSYTIIQLLNYQVGQVLILTKQMQLVNLLHFKQTVSVKLVSNNNLYLDIHLQWRAIV